MSSPAEDMRGRIEADTSSSTLEEEFPPDLLEKTRGDKERQKHTMVLMWKMTGKVKKKKKIIKRNIQINNTFMLQGLIDYKKVEKTYGVLQSCQIHSKYELSTTKFSHLIHWNHYFLGDYIFHLVSQIVRLSTQAGQAANPLMSAVHGHKSKDFQLYSQ